MPCAKAREYVNETESKMKPSPRRKNRLPYFIKTRCKKKKKKMQNEEESVLWVVNVNSPLEYFRRLNYTSEELKKNHRYVGLRCVSVKFKDITDSFL